ncbi:MAG TPA: Lpg1974 family pore-forming outer membrane protein [Candidatus Polarisedimenticolia bacterium]|nr:Lpg1974 family pore-forming outer membrane protein [Candidatus Polarisedimenticolia bacterium]
MTYPRDRAAGRWFPRIAVILVVAALACVATPAAAADKEYEGWFAFLDLASSQPNSLDQHYANSEDYTGTPLKRRLTLENDSDMTYRVGVGYGFGKGLGSLQVSYWSFDNDDRESGTVNGGLYPTLFGSTTYYGYSIYLYNSSGVDFRAGSKTKASTTDLDYIRPITSGDKVSLHWLAGLRVASYEEDVSFEGHDGTNDYFQAKHLKSDAWGMRVGAGALFSFTDHFGIKSSMVFSFLQADTKGRSSQTLSIGSPPSDVAEADDDNIRGEIRDFDLKAVWSYGHLDYFVGYSMSNWDGLVTDPVPSSDNSFNGGGASRGRNGISFNSVHAGVKWRFGGS